MKRVNLPASLTERLRSLARPYGLASIPPLFRDTLTCPSCGSPLIQDDYPRRGDYYVCRKYDCPNSEHYSPLWFMVRRRYYLAE